MVTRPAPAAALLMHPKLVADLFPADLADRLARTVEFDPGAATADVSGIDRLDRVEILITGWGCPAIDPDVLDRAPRLRGIVHAAGTVKGHLHPAVFERGLAVSTAADANAVPVAEFTLSALVLAAKGAFTAAGDYAAGKEVFVRPPAEDRGLYGAVVGIVGASRIGRAVIGLLADHGVHTLIADPYFGPREARELGAEPVGLDDLCRRSDLVSLHAPALPETTGMIDARRLALLRGGAALINTARGSLVDTDALTAECATGRISAVLDVTDPEPLPPDHPLLRLPNVFVTPHLAGSRGRELRRLGEFAVTEVERLVRGEALRGRIRGHDLDRIA
ncbi:hydroxyacid dehydrogenase [Glycomyces salinus]|uniref:hydroxyacid dehydrogenase n=1 Tax=Glycomyces salinus TaxID=980294 RepID=UPI0018EE04A0|nr:hydroxyacid dehydrogenase [Glycomyces salinus]